MRNPRGSPGWRDSNQIASGKPGTVHFKSYDEILAICCEAWNKLIGQPWTIMSIGHRKWAHGF